MPISNKPAVLTCKLNSTETSFEIDSGSHVSTLIYCDALKADAFINCSSRRLIGYSGSQINTLGETLIKVDYNGKIVENTFSVVPNTSVNLLGRDFMF